MSLESPRADVCVRTRIEASGSLEERSAIRAVNTAALGGLYEADLIDKLRTDGNAIISLVAEIDAGIIGHIMFSRMWIRTSTGLASAVASAPVAVLPKHQRKGTGGRLIRHGLELLRSRGENVVIVVGHPDYYPKFVFSQEKASSLASSFPADAFMAMELRAGAPDGIQGAVVYPPAFGIDGST
jgi:putative acetyltransferase